MQIETIATVFDQRRLWSTLRSVRFTRTLDTEKWFIDGSFHRFKPVTPLLHFVRKFPDI
jgi:hypothetical protein